MSNRTSVSSKVNVDQPALPMRSRLRERMKTELRETALEMFIEHGFDNVSSEQIAKRAGVSQRTFYRMFETKEEVLLAWLDHYASPVIQALRDAPSNLSPLEALRMAFIEPARIGEPGQQARDALVQRLIAQSPRLRAGYSERVRLWAKDLAVILAERSGSTLTSDPGPAIWAAAAFAAVSVANDWALEARDENLINDPVAAVGIAFDRLGSIMSPPSEAKSAASPRRKRA
jgi:AcrR family transcriptional regulator